MEIYREQIHDLLSDRRVIKCYNSSAATVSREVVKYECSDYRSAIRVVEKGNRERIEAKTALNANSSRGHMLILLEKGEGETLCVVDLAGKEDPPIEKNEIQRQLQRYKKRKQSEDHVVI